MKRHFYLLLCLIGISFPLAAQHNLPFDDGWTYVLKGESHRVTLPHQWNQHEAFAVPIAELSTDTVRYCKTFRLPKQARGKRVIVEFDGARQMAEVSINGHTVALSENGVTAFGCDLTPYLDFRGENRLEVLTDNSWDYRERSSNSRYQWNDKNFNANYGGLRGHARLHLLGSVHQTLPLWSSFGTRGVYVYPQDINLENHSATITAESEVKNDGTESQTVRLQAVIYSPSHTLLGTVTGEEQRIEPGQMKLLTCRQPLADIDFWSWGHGSLYTVVTRVLAPDDEVLDETQTITGFRKTEFGEGKIRLNGRTLMVHGYAQRTSNEWPGAGTSIPQWLSDYSNQMMVASGGNMVRWMHIMPQRQDVESCDRVGLPQAVPAGDSERDVEGRRWEHRLAVMADAIVENRNNPSVLFWECGNESISEQHMQQMKALRDSLDPHGGRAIGSREMLDPTSVAEYGGEMLYINKSQAKPLWAMEYCRDEGLRRYADAWSAPYYHKEGDGPLYRDQPAEAYNHNQDQLAVEHVRRWFDYWQQRPGMGKRVSSGGVKIVFSDTNTHCRGESNYRTSGVVDAMRLPKDSYWTHRVMWNGWVEPESPDIYIMGHWNYSTSTVKPIYVVSNTDSVQLELNGEALPALRREYQYLWTLDSLAWQPGELKAIGLNGGSEACSYVLQTAGEPHHLQVDVLTGPNGLQADGADMALVTFQVVDAEGRRCPTDHRSVSFTLEGEATWMGGIGPGERNLVGSTTLPVECGVNRALIQSTTQKGKVRLTASAEGLQPVTLEWKSGSPVQSAHIAPFTLKNERDATPAGESYHDLLRTIEPVAIHAGTGDSLAMLSHDDNENTEWKNDGTLATGWIRYELAQPERVDLLSLKLTGWRMRSYPLEIVDQDGGILWQGSTPQSLGYVSLPLSCSKPIRSLTIRLKGAAEEQEAFGQVVELAAPVAGELDLFKAKDGDQVRQELRIVECDLLQRIADSR